MAAYSYILSSYALGAFMIVGYGLFVCFEHRKLQRYNDAVKETK